MKTHIFFSLLFFTSGWMVAQRYPGTDLHRQIQLEKLTREFMNDELQHPDLKKMKTYFSPDATFLWPTENNPNLTLDTYLRWRANQLLLGNPKVEIQDVHVVGNESMVYAEWTGIFIYNPEKPEIAEQLTKASFVYWFFWEHGKIKRMEMYWNNKNIGKKSGRNP